MTGSLGTILYGIIGGFVGWFATDFLARPIRQFFQLRGEVCQTMVMFDNIRAMRNGEPNIFDPRLKEAQETFRLLGSRMLAFAHTEWLANWLIVRLRYDPVKAGRSLIGVSHSIGTAGERYQHKQNVMAALRITGL